MVLTFPGESTFFEQAVKSLNLHATLFKFKRSYTPAGFTGPKILKFSGSLMARIKFRGDSSSGHHGTYHVRRKSSHLRQPQRFSFLLLTPYAPTLFPSMLQILVP
jgi:hypothetical protein